MGRNQTLLWIIVVVALVVILGGTLFRWWNWSTAGALATAFFTLLLTYYTANLVAVQEKLNALQKKQADILEKQTEILHDQGELQRSLAEFQIMMEKTPWLSLRRQSVGTFNIELSNIGKYGALVSELKVHDQEPKEPGEDSPPFPEMVPLPISVGPGETRIIQVRNPQQTWKEGRYIEVIYEYETRPGERLSDLWFQEKSSLKRIWRARKI